MIFTKPIVGSFAAVLFSSAVLGVGAGCGGGGAQVNTDPKIDITSLTGIDPKDLESAASQLADSMLRSPEVASIQKKPAILVINPFIADVDDSDFDTGVLIKPVVQVLMKSQRFREDTTSLWNDVSQDRRALELKRKKRYLSGQDPTDDTADYSLSGKIIDSYQRAGNVRQVSYIFQMTLTEISSGLAIWDDQVRITKQGTKASVGF